MELKYAYVRTKDELELRKFGELGWEAYAVTVDGNLTPTYYLKKVI